MLYTATRSAAEKYGIFSHVRSVSRGGEVTSRGAIQSPPAKTVLAFKVPVLTNPKYCTISNIPTK